MLKTYTISGEFQGEKWKSFKGLISRNEHWTGHGLDWNRTMTNLLVLDCIRLVNCFIKLGSGPDLDWVNGKELRNFCCWKSCILLIFSTLFGLGLWIFNKVLDYGWTWTEFSKFRIGSGSQNMTVRSSLLTSHVKINVLSKMQPFQEVWRIFAEFGYFLKWVWQQFFVSIWQPCWDERTVKFFSPSPVQIKLNPIQSWSAKVLKIISPIQSWSAHVKSCILFCLMRQKHY